MAKSTKKTGKQKGDFPLWLRKPPGVWCKTIGTKRHYFTCHKQESLDTWLAQKDYLLAGKKPPGERAVLKDLLNSGGTAGGGRRAS